MRTVCARAAMCGATLLTVLTVGCEGVMNEPSGPGFAGDGHGANTAGDEHTGTASACADQELDPGPAPLHLLTKEQYLLTVRDLLGEVPGLEQVMAPAQTPSAFGLVQPAVSQVEVERYQQAALLIARTLSADQARLSAFVPCASGEDPRSCARAFVQRLTPRADRAPLEAADVERHLALYDRGAELDHAHGIELVLQGILQAPRFLYQVELGTGEQASPRARKLSPHELAARLSYFVWNSAPSGRLLEAAESGRLDSKEGVAAELAWMLDDERGKGLLGRFLSGWLRVADVDTLVKDEARFPDWASGSVRTAVKAQAGRFFEHVLQDEHGSLAALLTSPAVFVNGDLASYYASEAGADFVRVDMPDRMSGILTLPSLLSVLAKPDQSSPIYRGKFVRESLLCQLLPSPPANVPKPPEVQAGVSTRERLAQHEVDPACSGCHRLMDPIGFAFEHFDAVGHYRSDDGGEPVDARGELFAAQELDGKIDGVLELGQRLAGSPQVEECVARQWFRFALHRFEREVDDCTLERMLHTFRAEGANLHALPRAVVTSDAFLYLRASKTEESP